MTRPDTNISYEDHRKDMAEFEPFMEFLEDQTEMETAVKYLMEFPNTEYLGEEFEQAYYQAVRSQLKWFKENAIIKTEKKKETIVERTYRYMEYKDEQ